MEQVPCRACRDRDVDHRGYGLIRIITGRNRCNPFARMRVRSHARKRTYAEHTRNAGTQGYAESRVCGGSHTLGTRERNARKYTATCLRAATQLH